MAINSFTKPGACEGQIFFPLLITFNPVNTLLELKVLRGPQLVGEIPSYEPAQYPRGCVGVLKLLGSKDETCVIWQDKVKMVDGQLNYRSEGS